MNPAGRNPIFKFAHEAMTTIFELILWGIDESYASQFSHAVFDEISHLEGLLDRFNPCSEISQINRLKSGESMEIGIEVFECLETAERIRLQTNGAFDINIGSLIEYQGEAGDHSSDSSENAGPLALKLFGSPEGFRVEVPSGQSGSPQLDLGGIGKGFVLDRILEILSDWDIDSSLIHGGTSSALARGRPDTEGAGWAVGVGGDWDCHQAPDTVYLEDRALSGSGFEVKGAHIVDPRSGKPAHGHIAAWVSHPSAAVADALSTAFMVMSLKEVEDYCRIYKDVWTLLVISSQKCRVFNPEVVSVKNSRSEDRK